MMFPAPSDTSRLSLSMLNMRTSAQQVLHSVSITDQLPLDLEHVA